MAYTVDEPAHPNLLLGLIVLVEVVALQRLARNWLVSFVVRRPAIIPENTYHLTRRN